MLARTLVRQGRYDRGAILDAYVYWWGRHAWDHGGTLRQYPAAITAAAIDSASTIQIAASRRRPLSRNRLRSLGQ